MNHAKTNQKAVRIIGIDPGSRLTGYGVVEVRDGKILRITHGTLELSNVTGKTIIAFEQRLVTLFQELSQIIEAYKPQMMSIEKVFFAKNAVSALKLGQARGVAMVCGALQGLKIVEYNPTEVKANITGSGRADKDQIAKMLQLLMGQQSFITSDASDGLALAYCHAKFISNPSYAELSLQSSSRSQALYKLTATKGKKKMSLAESVGLKSPAKQGKLKT